MTVHQLLMSRSFVALCRGEVVESSDSLAALVEVLAGYTLLHATRQQLKRARASTASLDLAARLIAAVNTAPSFKGAAMQLVNDLSRQMRADRVAMGWAKGIGTSGAIRAVAMSDTELIDRWMAMVQKICAKAMVMKAK